MEELPAETLDGRMTLLVASPAGRAVELQGVVLDADQPVRPSEVDQGDDRAVLGDDGHLELRLGIAPLDHLAAEPNLGGAAGHDRSGPRLHGSPKANLAITTRAQAGMVPKAWELIGANQLSVQGVVDHPSQPVGAEDAGAVDQGPAGPSGRDVVKVGDVGDRESSAVDDYARQAGGSAASDGEVGLWRRSHVEAGQCGGGQVGHDGSVGCRQTGCEGPLLPAQRGAGHPVDGAASALPAATGHSALDLLAAQTGHECLIEGNQSMLGGGQLGIADVDPVHQPSVRPGGDNLRSGTPLD